MLRIGMLWYDNSADSLDEKICRAAAYYTQKYGRQPNVCCLSAGESISGRVGEIILESSPSVLKNHLWLGVDHAGG